MKKEKLSAQQIQGLLAQLNPHYYSEENINVIQSGSPEELAELFKNKKLSCKEEIELVKNAPFEAVKTYIETRRILCEEAQVALIKRMNLFLVDCFLEKRLCRFASAAEVELISRYRLHSLKWWKYYFTGYSISGKAEVALVDTRDMNFLKMYLDDHTLEDDGCMRLLKTYTYDEISQLIRECPRFYLTKRAEAYFVENADPWLVALYFSKFSLYGPSQVALVKRGNHHLIMNFMERRKTLCDGAAIELAQRANYDEVSKLIEFKKLPSEAEAAIVKSNNNKLINLLINKGPLSPYAQFVIVKSKAKRHERIMRYLAKYPVDVTIVDLIIKRGNSDEIKACIKQRCLVGNTHELLIRRGRRDEIELYISVSHPEWKIPD